jgi:hypothetical protein
MIDENLDCSCKQNEAALQEHKGRVGIKDVLQNTLVSFDKLVSKGAPVEWDGVAFITDLEGEEFPLG